MALLDVVQRYTTIPLCNILPRRNPSHRIFIPQNQLLTAKTVDNHRPVRYPETGEGSVTTHE